MRAIIRPHLSVGHFSRVQAVNRVGPWSPVISVEVVPSETGGDILRVLTENGVVYLRRPRQRNKKDVVEPRDVLRRAVFAMPPLTT